MVQVAQIGGRGGNSGNARKKTFFSQEGFPKSINNVDIERSFKLKHKKKRKLSNQRKGVMAHNVSQVAMFDTDTSL